MTYLRFVLLGFLLSSSLCLAQPRVDRQNVGYRVIAIVPMVGTGTYDDPKRPLFAPRIGLESADVVSARGAQKFFNDAATGVIEFKYEVSDDGKWAIAEFVFQNRPALNAVMASGRTDVKIFEKGMASKALILAEAKKLKINFDLDAFHGGRRPAAAQAGAAQ